MKNFYKRLDEIYPPAISGFIIVTIIAIVGVILTRDKVSFFTPTTFVIFFVWMYSLYSTLVVQLTRKKIIKYSMTDKRELVKFLKKRILREKRRINILRRNVEMPKHELIRLFMLDVEKDKIMP